jgi:hypothetical protein
MIEGDFDSIDHRLAPIQNMLNAYDRVEDVLVAGV